MKIEEYQKALSNESDWVAYLAAQSHLPGPRGNLELASVAADLADEAHIQLLLAVDGPQVSENTPQVFVVFCGVVGLGKLLAASDLNALPILRRYAVDSRWRLREAVAMALQRWGDANMPALINEMEQWALGSPLEQRAAAAALCEPRLLHNEADVRRVLTILDQITNSLATSNHIKDESFQALKKGLGYCWSVAVAALPEAGKVLIEKWVEGSNQDVRWIMRENLTKSRLVRLDPVWVNRTLSRF